MPIHRVRFRRSFASVEEAFLDIDATDAFEALGKAKTLEDTGGALMEWREDADQFEELERMVWVDDPSRVITLA